MQYSRIAVKVIRRFLTLLLYTVPALSSCRKMKAVLRHSEHTCSYSEEPDPWILLLSHFQKGFLKL